MKHEGHNLKMVCVVELIISETTEIFITHESLLGISGIFVLFPGTLSALSAS